MYDAGNGEDLDKLLDLLPAHIRRKLLLHEELEDLVEIVLDLGRKPLARFPTGDWFISQDIVSSDDLEHAVSRVIYCPIYLFADTNAARSLVKI